MTVRAVCILRVQIVLRARRFLRADTMCGAVTGQAKLRNAARDQQTRIRRTVWRVTRDAAIGLDRSMLVNKRSLLVCMTLDAGCVGAGSESRLLELEAAVRIVAIAALHHSFEHLVMKRQVELVPGFAVTTQAKLWLALAKQLQIRQAGLLRICR